MSNPKTVSDINIRHEILGMENLLIPFPERISSQRASMFASNIAQSVVIDGCEPPRISTGYENQFGEYSFSTTRREDEGTLFDVIPKFEVGIGEHNVSTTPSRTVLIDTPKGLDCIEISDYTKTYDGFGYENVIKPTALYLNRESGTFIDKDLEFVTPPNHKNGMYCLGVDANVANITAPQVTEDAFVVRKGWADKLEHSAIHSERIFVTQDMTPVNSYGSETEPKAFPDVGEFVNDEGILMALRPKDEASFADLTNAAISQPRLVADTIVKVPAGAQVIDVQVYSDISAFRKSEDNPGIMSQFIKYQKQHYRYYSRIIECYERAKAAGLKLTPRMADLITRCMCLKRPSKRESNITFVDKRVPIQHFAVDITYSYKRKVSKGFKLTGRWGDKGVISDVWPDEHMPVDEQGIRADIIISPETVINRINTGQWYEQFLNRMCSLMTIRYKNGEFGNDDVSYETLMNFLTDVRREYGRQLREFHGSHDSRKIQFLDDVRTQGLFLIIPPACSDITMKRMSNLAKKWNYVESKLTYTFPLPDGSFKTVTTKHPSGIGSKYIYLLSKIPSMQTSALEISHVSQFGIPTKAKNKVVKMQHMYKATPLRIGEDEVSIMIMCMKPEDVARFLGIRTNCQQATELMMMKLLTSRKPSAIGSIPMTTEHMVNNSIPARIFTHYLGILGLDISSSSAGRK